MASISEKITEIAPLALEPLVTERSWGATGHSSFNGPAKAQGLKWGEIWLATEDFGLSSKVSSGPFEGNHLKFFRERWGAGFTGQISTEIKRVLNFSLRIERTGAEPGPVRVFSGEEFWYVLEAGLDSWLGLGTTSDEGPWPSRLNKVSVESGDRFLLPKGFVRAQGPNLTILKALVADSIVQTLYDWDRKPDVWGFTPPPIDIDIENSALLPLKTICEGRNRLFYQGPFYSVKLINTDFVSDKGKKFSILCPVKGRGRIQVSGHPDNIRLNPGQAVVLPAGLGRYSIQSGTIISYLLFESTF
jgi:mannose-6-phosphate isomerase class I